MLFLLVPGLPGQVIEGAAIGPDSCLGVNFGVSMDYGSGPGKGGPLGADLPAPQSGRAGAGKLIFLAILCMLALACASFWLSRAPAQRMEMRQATASRINDFLAETPLAGLGDFLAANTAPVTPPPESVTNPPTEEGTLAGRQVIGTIAAPMDFGPLMPRAPRHAEPEGKTLREVIHEAAEDLAQFVGGQEKEPVVFSQDYVPPATEDKIVQPRYLASLSRWLVNRFKPGPQGGSLAVSAQSLNQECGVRLAGEAPGGRQALLRYAFQPEMIGGLYRLYINRFLADLNEAAVAKGWTGAENRAFHAALAGRAAIYATALEGVMGVADLRSRLAHIDAVGEKVVDSNLAVTEAVFDLDELRQAKASSHLLTTAQLKVNGATARYRRVSEEYAQAQSSLAAAIRKLAGPGLDDDTLLFVATWVARREKDFVNSRPALESCVAVLRDFASRCHAVAEAP